MEKRCLILDGFALTYRAYFALPTTIRTRYGPINAVLGFYNTLLKLINQVQPDFLVVASDSKGPTFRHEAFPQYKAQRPPMPEELRSQLPLIKEVLTSCNIPVLELPGFEADDIIGTITNYLPQDTLAYVVTTDRDALQLADEQVTILAPSGKENKIFTPEIVQLEWGISPQLIPDIKALMGDNSDNIPGVPKVGPKTAVKWLCTYGSLEQIIENAHELTGKVGESLREHRDEAVFYKHLATIKRDVPLFYCWQSLRLSPDLGKLKGTLEQIGIRAALPTG